VVESAIFGQAMREYLRPRRLLPWLALAAVCLVLASLWRQLEPGATAQQRYMNVSSILVFRILALVSAIFTTAIVSQEVEQRTIVYLLTRPVQRWKLLLIRYGASVLVVALVSLIAAALASFGAYSGRPLSNPLFLKDAEALIVGAFAYGALFLFVSLLFNRALIICALFAFGWEASISNMPGEMYRMSIFSYLQAIAEHPNTESNRLLGFISGALGDNAISRGSAYTTLIVMTVVLLGISAWWFTQFEYVPREDAE